MIKNIINKMITEIDDARMIFLGNSYSMYDRYIDYFRYYFNTVIELLKEENSIQLQKIEEAKDLFEDLMKPGDFNNNHIELIKINLIEVRDSLKF